MLLRVNALRWQRNNFQIQYSMGKTEDNKYTSDKDRYSQVRNIISQLNSDRPSHEKKREVVVRADGTKAVRVVKKRKVMITSEERNRRSRRHFVYSLLVFVLVIAVLACAFAYKMSRMSGEEYYRELAGKIAQALGAQDVQLSGARLDGLDLLVDNLVAEFPEGMMVQRLEMSEISCTLSASSFFTGLLKTSNVQVARATLTSPRDVRKVDVPVWQGDDIWSIDRLSCDDFNFSFGEVEGSPLAISHSSAYMYFAGRSREARVVVMKGGNLSVKGWVPMELLDAKVQVTPVALENVRLTATPETHREGNNAPSSHIAISGHLSGGSELSSAMGFDSDNMDFSGFSNGRFSHLLVAKTAASATGKNKPVASIRLPFDSDRPAFSGFFALRDIRVSTMPALLSILEHIEPARRNAYLPIKISRGRVELSEQEGSTVLKFNENEFRELDLVSLQGEIAVNEANDLSGILTYGIPALLTHVEYPDGMADPLFRDDGAIAWVSTRLSGKANAPADDIDQLEAAAAEARADRPARTPFEYIDVDALTDQVFGKEGGSTPSAPENTSEDPAASEPEPSSEPTPTPSNNSGNPFAPSDPFAPTPNPLDSPFGGGLTVPVDKSVFPSG